jgi:hypothetical protein
MNKTNEYMQLATVRSRIPAGAAEPAPPGRRRSAPAGGSALHEVKSVGAYSGRRSGPPGGQGATRSARPWGPHAS